MEIHFWVPSSFREVTLGLDERAAREMVRERAVDASTTLSEEDIHEHVSRYLRMSSYLETAGAFYAASFLGVIDGTLSSCSLTMAVLQEVHADPQIAIPGIGHVVREHRGADVATKHVVLPCGEALLLFTQDAHLCIPAQLTDDDEDVPLSIGQAQAYIPVPEHQALLIVTLSTPSLDHWEHYCEVLVKLLRSVTISPVNSAARSERGRSTSSSRHDMATSHSAPPHAYPFG